MPIILVIVFTLILAAVVNYAQRLMQKQISRSTAALAESLGLTYAVEQSPARPGVPGDFLLFAQGSPRSRQNVMEGQYQGVQVSAYDYTFVKALERFDESFRQTVIQIKTKRTGVPQFSLCPQDQLNAIMINLPSQQGREKLLGTAGIRLPHHPEFRNQYKLMGTETRKLQGIFDNETVIEALTAFDAKPLKGQVCLEGAGQYLFIYPLYQHIPLKGKRDFLDKSVKLTQHIEAAIASHLECEDINKIQ